MTHVNQSRRATLLVLSLAMLAALAGPACESTGSNKVVPLTKGGEDTQLTLPSQILGLTVRAEDIGKQVAAIDNPYIDGMGLFSMREGELLRATLQISRFAGVAPYRTTRFQDRIAGQVGGRLARRVRFGEAPIYITSARQEHLFMWFEGRAFFVLTIHRSYAFPRTLARRLVDRDFKL